MKKKKRISHSHNYLYGWVISIIIFIGILITASFIFYSPKQIYSDLKGMLGDLGPGGEELSGYGSGTYGTIGIYGISCGNGLKDSFEGCDDGNRLGGDGCSIVCAVEIGWTCIGEPSSCVINNPSPLDSDNDGINDSIDHCPNTPVELISFINVYGCVKPKHTKFNMGSDLHNLELSDLSDFEIGILNNGKIKYNQKVNLQNNAKQIDLDFNINIFQNKIELNSSAIPELNSSAILTFYNVSFVNPQILKDGVDCGDCQRISWSSKTLEVNVTHFTTYELEEGLYCGDLICNNDGSENCSSCSSDCGACPTTLTCSDGVQNQGETGVDCGGPCSACSSGGGSNGGGGSSGGASCTPKWNCSWSPCANQVQEWVCVDSSKCGTNKNKPATETKVCSEEQTGTGSETEQPQDQINLSEKENKANIFVYSIVGIIIFIIAIIIILLVLFRKK